MTKKAAFHLAASETSPPLLCRRLCAKPRQMTFEQPRPRSIVRRCDLRVHGPNNANDRRAYVREYCAVDQRLDQPSQHYQHCRQTQNCHCKKYLRVARHLCQKLDHPPARLN
jgi:hypothetical protein